MPKKDDALDLYAKVEDLLGVKEAAPRLYEHYLFFLKSIACDTLLDVGCGMGNFLFQVQERLDLSQVKGIDLSSVMVSKTREQGIDAEHLEMCEVEAQYDVITAVFDMLNYLDKEECKRFFSCLKSHLHEGGYFLCDINTLYGFENVAVGSYIVDDEERFLTVDSDFEHGKYIAEFTLFEKKGTCYLKSQGRIRQYYYSVDDIVRYSGLKLLANENVTLYALDEADKHFLVFQKI